MAKRKAHNRSKKGFHLPPPVSDYPIATVAYYGPDDKTTTKIAVGIVNQHGHVLELQRWIGPNVTTDPEIKVAIYQFIEQHGANKVLMTDGNMGCPHEEGIDFPEGEDCPVCPFWAGKQGSAAQK